MTVLSAANRGLGIPAKPGLKLRLTTITVLDLSRLLPGPYGSMILADHGARVIAIEARQFLADNLYLTTINRNKEHISLNLKTEKGKENSKAFFTKFMARVFFPALLPGRIRLLISLSIILTFAL